MDDHWRTCTGPGVAGGPDLSVKDASFLFGSTESFDEQGKWDASQATEFGMNIRQ